PYETRARVSSCRRQRRLGDLLLRPCAARLAVWRRDHAACLRAAEAGPHRRAADRRGSRPRARSAMTEKKTRTPRSLERRPLERAKEKLMSVLAISLETANTFYSLGLKLTVWGAAVTFLGA